MDDECQPFVSDCHLRLATDLLAHTWDPVVLSALRAGGWRRADLLVEIGGLSDKVLTESLRRLTASGLVDRAEEPRARHTTYSLTELGDSLANGPMAALGRWAVEYGDQVLEAQSRQAETTGIVAFQR